MTAAKVDAGQALAAAAGAVTDAKPIMVRGIASDESAEGTAWMVTMRKTNEGGTRTMTIVLVDSGTGAVLGTETFEPGRFGPRMGGPRGGMMAPGGMMPQGGMMPRGGMTAPGKRAPPAAPVTPATPKAE